jgi:aspartyl-tRNA(Asn)/glutamyl-tRNA(Gln) amidotransferase subunit A
VTIPAEFNDITDARAALAAGVISARELVAAALQGARRLQPQLNCFVDIEEASALAAADRADHRRAQGLPVGALDGIPFGYKDMYYRAGRICGCGSKIRANWVPDLTATVVTRIEAEGAAPLGRLHMTEFAGGPTGHNEHLGPCHNPWNTERITGGSSSGSGSALGAGLVLGALGSDTGGSLRLPAAMCGVNALFPTRGRISRHGAMPLAPSMDVVGPMARSLRDCALLFRLMAGPDPMDPTTSPAGAARALPDGSLRGVRIGVADPIPGPALGADHRAVYEATLRLLETEGAIVVPIALPWIDEALALGGVVTRSETAAAHARWHASQPEDYGRILRFRIGVGLSIAARDYLDALALRVRLARDFEAQVFGRCDLLMLPTYFQGAPSIASLEPNDDNLETVWAGVGDLTRPFNYLGLPAVQMPCGFDSDGMPLGMQWLGRPYDDERLLAWGGRFQAITDWHRRRPLLDGTGAQQ